MEGQPVVLAADAASNARVDRLAGLFDAHADRLYRLARRLAANADEARDLVQETFLRAARSPGSVPAGPRREEAWLVRVLINIRRDEWRRNEVRTRPGAMLPPQSSPGDVDPESALIARRTVWRALDMLPPRRRAVVVMHELEGKSIAAIASLLGVTAVTVRWHLSRGRRDLTRALGRDMGEMP